MNRPTLLDSALNICPESSGLAELFVARLNLSAQRPAVRYHKQGEAKVDSWAQLALRVAAIASRLRALGVPPGGCVGLFMPTGYAWAQADMACLLHGWISAAYHSAWQVMELVHAISLSRPDAIVCSETQLPLLQEALAQLDWKTPLLCLPLAEGSKPSTSTLLPNSLPPPDAPATIVFTSGTGGKAKGVILSQNAILQSAYHAYNQLGFYGSGSRTLHWLPASHMFGRLGLYLDMLAGATAHFNQNVEHLLHDMAFAQPHSLFAVPRMLTRLRQRIEERVQAKPAPARWAFRGLHCLGGWLAQLPATPRVKLQRRVRKLFPAVHTPIGGNLELIVVGGAPVDPGDKDYFEALGIAVREGFGMTETAGVAAVQPLRAPGRGAGHLLPSVCAKLDSQGQLLLKGRSLLSGYLGEDAFDSQGWFATGDIASLNRDGSLSIVGRVKDLIIPETGENVSPAKLEALLTRHHWVADACVIGDRRPCLVVLLSLSESGLRFWQEQGSSALCQGLDQLLDDTNNGLPRFERILASIVLPEALSAEHGELTATQKMRRAVICNRHQTRIEQCYAMLRQRSGRHLLPEPEKLSAAAF